MTAALLAGCGLGFLVAAQVGEDASLDYAVIQHASEEARIFMHRSALCKAGATMRA